MAYDYFTVQALAGELSSRLQGAEINRAYSQGHMLAFTDGGEEGWFSGVGGREGLLYLRQDPWPRDWNAGEGPEKYLVRARVVEVSCERRERLIRLRLERSDRSGQLSYGVLVCLLIPHKIQFILHREEGGEILGVWGGVKGGAKVGEGFQSPQPAGRLLPGEDAYDAWSEFSAEGGDIEKVVRRRMAGADANVARELCYRARGAEDQTKAIWELAEEAYTREIASGAYVWEDGTAVHFSALEPRRLQGACTAFDGVSQAIGSARMLARERRRDQQAGQKVKVQLKQALKNGRRRLGAMHRDLEEAERAEEYEKKGNVLLSQVAHITSGQTQIELPDIYDPNGRTSLVIDLDPNRSPAENAARYLKAVKKYQRRQQILPKRIAELEKNCSTLEEWFAAVEANTWRDDGQLHDWLVQRGTKMEHKHKSGPSAHPRRYRTTTGWSVWAGRNNKENDVLTHKMSAQNDMWFHAHGYPGSHVVLRREGRKEEPDKQTLEEAAAVAAFWSKGKTAKKVSVVYTQVKYVTKPRGGAPGQALLKREKTVVVEPSLLSEEKDI